MPRVRSRNAYQHVSDFDKGQIVAYRDYGLSYRSITARVDRDLMTRHRGERTWAARIRHRHTGPSPGMMTWGAVEYTSRSPFVRIDGPLNSVIRFVTLSFIRALRNLTFQQDNARPHVASIVRTFLDMENVRLLPWPARSPDFS
ncbi:transposable element Tcb1 transposase [Trichonephila clavipes]|nr:transposable element Tcb1 transposase [Trichonephila clavipes]